MKVTNEFETLFPTLYAGGAETLLDSGASTVEPNPEFKLAQYPLSDVPIWCMAELALRKLKSIATEEEYEDFLYGEQKEGEAIGLKYLTVEESGFASYALNQLFDGPYSHHVYVY